MNKKNNNKGFTLAELLIVVAIIAVLVAIAIPVFSAQLEKSKESTDLANVRSAYATLVAKYLEDNAANGINVPAKQADAATWVIGDHSLETMSNGIISSINIPAKSVGQTYSVSIDANGNVTVT